MKKGLFNLGSLVLILFAASCSNNDDAVSESSQLTLKAGQNRYTPEEFNYLGEEHNRIVHAFYNEWLAKPQTEKTAQDFGTSIIINETSKYNTTAEDGDLTRSYASVYMHKEFSDPQVFYSFVDRDNRLSSNVKGYLDQVLHAFYDETLSIKDVHDVIADVEVKSYNDPTLTNEDLSILYSGTSIADNSLTYWENNYLDWEGNIGTTTAASKGKTPGRHIAEIAAADFAGGVGAAVGAWAVNVWVGPGQVAYGGAIVAGAVGTSVTTALVKITDMIFDLW
ncbi:hypothetical protein Q763_16205 [Flavobacterium beibuense F44-8]|uniref:Lipoprotein n=1 Tax=Flavobacterium beibuense F44-8 TaxID=1406840 RepID=A0A0A2LI80_9FLAO|nr:hypothetical protein [Flavobacterium beibuense]KGO78931.1 hypothetical protein Q763_16205 [Flavobacterium beibuense F44-8]